MEKVCSNQEDISTMSGAGTSRLLLRNAEADSQAKSEGDFTSSRWLREMASFRPKRGAESLSSRSLRSQRTSAARRSAGGNGRVREPFGATRTPPLKLSMQFIPAGAAGRSLRTFFPTRWREIRNEVLRLSGGVCECCQRQRDLQVHEVWEFDHRATVQRLLSCLAVCDDCNRCIHWGRTLIKAAEEGISVDRLAQHFLWVNQCTFTEMFDEYERARIEYRLASQIDWRLDLSKFTQGNDTRW
jgi:hypothetical protein